MIVNETLGPVSTLGPISRTGAGVRVAIRLTPGAARERLDGVVPDADGGRMLKVSVTAIPEDGKANAALIKFLSKQWKVPKSDFKIVHGLTDRRKVVEICGDPETLMDRLTLWMASLS